MNPTLGLDFTLFFFCAVSESESSSESISELEEVSDGELLAWATGPLPFSSESLKHTRKADSDLSHQYNHAWLLNQLFSETSQCFYQSFNIKKKGFHTPLGNTRKHKVGNKFYSPSLVKVQPGHNNINLFCL